MFVYVIAQKYQEVSFDCNIKSFNDKVPDLLCVLSSSILQA